MSLESTTCHEQPLVPAVNQTGRKTRISQVPFNETGCTGRTRLSLLQVITKPQIQPQGDFSLEEACGLHHPRHHATILIIIPTPWHWSVPTGCTMSPLWARELILTGTPSRAASSTSHTPHHRIGALLEVVLQMNLKRPEDSEFSKHVRLQGLLVTKDIWLEASP